MLRTLLSCLRRARRVFKRPAALCVHATHATCELIVVAAWVRGATPTDFVHVLDVVREHPFGCIKAAVAVLAAVCAAHTVLASLDRVLRWTDRQIAQRLRFLTSRLASTARRLKHKLAHWLVG